MNWSELEWSGVELIGVEWSGVEWSGVEWSGSSPWLYAATESRVGLVLTIIHVLFKVTIPAQETTYWCSLLKGPELNSKHHITAVTHDN